jgi:hypothetical protein
MTGCFVRFAKIFVLFWVFLFDAWMSVLWFRTVLVGQLFLNAPGNAIVVSAIVLTLLFFVTPLFVYLTYRFQLEE